MSRNRCALALIILKSNPFALSEHRSFVIRISANHHYEVMHSRLKRRE